MLRAVICSIALLLAASAHAQSFEDKSSALAGFEHRSQPFGGDGTAGAAWFDYDGDGNLDLYLTNGKTQHNALFRNNGDGTFSDVAAAAGVQNGGGNSGVLAADFDNDGDPDLFLTGDGGMMGTGDSPIKLYQNNGDGTFLDVTASSGIVPPVTHASAAAADIDNDGRLDLFITAIGSLTTGTNHKSQLYRNLGGLTFQDISLATGVDTLNGACANAFSDYNQDGNIDLVIADCNEVNFAPTPVEIHRNNGSLSFSNMTGSAGTNTGGYWMGVCPADFNNDQKTDLFVTNFGTALPFTPHALYQNQGNGTFSNIAASAQVANHEFAWGCSAADFNNDGWTDLFFVGSLPVLQPVPLIGPGSGNPGRYLVNQANDTFADQTASVPLDLSNRYTSGVAHADYDNDGQVDLLVATEEFNGDLGHPVLLRNLGSAGHWLTLDLMGTTSNRDAIGAFVTLAAGGMTQAQEVYAGTSFLSTHSKRLHFGLGASAAASRITIRWPSGLVETLDNVPADQILSVVEGQNGVPVPLLPPVALGSLVAALLGAGTISAARAGKKPMMWMTSRRHQQPRH